MSMFRKLVATTPTWVSLPLRLTHGAALCPARRRESVWHTRRAGAFSMDSERKSGDGLAPVWLWLGAAALFELIGGILILTGFLTRLGALLVIPIMLVAIYGILTGD